ARLDPAGVAHQHGLHRAPQLNASPPCRRRRAARTHAVQGCSQLTLPTAPLPHVLQLLLTSQQLTCASGPPSANEREGFGQAVAPVYAGRGRGADRSRLDTARGTVVSGSTVASAAGAVSRGGQWRSHGGDGCESH